MTKRSGNFWGSRPAQAKRGRMGVPKIIGRREQDWREAGRMKTGVEDFDQILCNPLGERNEGPLPAQINSFSSAACGHNI